MIIAAMTVPGDVVAAPPTPTSMRTAEPLRPNPGILQQIPPAQVPAQAETIGRAGPSLVTPATTGGAGRGASPSQSDRTVAAGEPAGGGSAGEPASFAWSLVYSSLITLVIATCGLLLLGSRRRLW